MSNFDNWIVATFGSYQHPHENEYVVDCPACGAVKRCSINPIKRVVNCYRCGGANLFSWLREHYNMSNAQIRALVNEDGPPISVAEFESALSGLGASSDPTVASPIPRADFSNLDIRWIGHGDLVADSIPIQNYLARRGFTLKDAREWRLAYCPSGKYAGRLLLPVFEGGKLVYFQGRAVYGQEPKYLNPGKAEGVERDHYVFNLDAVEQTLKEAVGTVVICEGAFNSMSVREPSIALFGKHMSRVQCAKIAKAIPPQNLIIIAFDHGTHSEAYKVAQMLHNHYKNVWVLYMPDERDLNDWRTKGYNDPIKAAIDYHYKGRLRQVDQPYLERILGEL